MKGICGPAREGRERAPSAAPARPDRAAQAATAPTRRRLGTFGAWEAWTAEESEGPACYALAYAAPAPGENQDWKSRLWVAHRPWRAMDDVGFAPGTRPPDGAAIWIEFDGRRSAMRMQRHHAAPRNGAALSAALRGAAAAGAAEAVIGWTAVGDDAAVATPSRSHRFALRGPVEAHAAAGAACEAAP